MARLNEPALSTDNNIEICRRPSVYVCGPTCSYLHSRHDAVRKKMLRQNRELAKNNNIRALRVRELESELSRALTENLELRGRIIELEHEAQDNDVRRVSDNTMAIKQKMEAQLAEWGTLIAGLGLEASTTRSSPKIAKMTSTSLSFTAARPSPSQRRLREIANDIEQLGHISEHKTYPRKSMKYVSVRAWGQTTLLITSSPEQIQALRSELDSEEIPELPPPVPAAIRKEPAKVDTPPRESRARNFTSGLDSSPLVVSSPNLDNLRIGSMSPQKKMTPMIRESRVHIDPTPDTPIAPPTKAGSKRKFARDEYEPMTLEKITDENCPPRILADKTSILTKAHGKTLKELASIRRDTARAKADPPKDERKPLAAKSTNDDMQSPKKMRRTTSTDEIGFLKTKNAAARPKPVKAKAQMSIKIDEVLAQNIQPVVATMQPGPLEIASATLSPSPGIISPSSPEPAAANDAERGDTPPPADIGFMGETSRPSRRNRPAISYAEPNLRDKMRRPRDEKFDAVSGEGKSRRFSHTDASALDLKRESGGSDAWKQLPAAHPRVSELSTESAPVSPLFGRSDSPQELPSSVHTVRRKRTSHTTTQSAPAHDDEDVYEFNSSSPSVDEASESTTTKRTSGRRTTASRRFSEAVESEADSVTSRDRIGSRRRSMMV